MIPPNVRTRAVAYAAVALAMAIVHVDPAVAQTSLTIRPMHVGDCQVVLQVTNPRPGDSVGLVVELTELREQSLIAGRTELTFALSEPLRQGYRVRTRVNGVAGREETVPAGSGQPRGECVAAPEAPDKTPFEASAFFGEVIDTFAPDNVGAYRNPEAGTSQKLQSIFGIDFDYRARGRSDDGVQFWINGQTMHGVRTADINCRPPDPADTPPICGKITDPNFAGRARFILEHASSLEAFVSPRLEFKTIQRGSDSLANLYVTGRLGFIALEDAPQVFRSFQITMGLRAKEGNFKDSFLEGGWGKNELFSNRWNRLKINGLLRFDLSKIPGVGDTVRFFVEMTVDNDLKDGPDSVRSYFGISLDLKNAFGGI